MKKILSCDGGGIRGKATTQFLYRIEQELNKHGTCMKEQVDFFAGTSTGAIIACALATTDLTITAINDLYSPENAGWIFSENKGLFEIDGINAPKYEDGGKKELLKLKFEGSKIGNVPDGKHVLVTAYSIEKRQPVIMKSTKESHRDIYSWKAADASSAAPTFFPTAEVLIDGERLWLIDGGVVANNPAMCAVSEAMKLWGMDIKILSVGTGYKTRKINGPESVKWGALGWFTKGDIIGLLSDERLVDHQVKTILGDNYIRVNSSMVSQPGLESPPDDAMDDVSVGNIEKLARMGDFWFELYGDETVNFLLS